MKNNLKNFGLTTIPIILVSLVFFILYFYLFGNLLIFTEARDYITYAGWITDYSSLIINSLIPSGQNSRYVSMFTFYLMKNTCGYENVCINAFQLIILLIAGILLYIHSYQIFKKVFLATLIATIWLFSLPTIDTSTWQATNHGKVAALFIFMTLILSQLFLAKGHKLAIVVLSNFIITISLILAYNAKESAFFLMPVVLLQYLLYSKLAELKYNLLKIVLPLLFSTYFLVGYFIKLPDFWKEHTLSNNITHTVTLYANYLLNSSWPSHFYLISLIIILGIAPVFLIGIKLLTKNKLKFLDNDLVKNLIYSYAFFILSLIIVIKARYPSIYYMLVPLSGLLLIIFSSIEFIVNYLSNFYKKILITLLSVLLLLHLYHYSQFLQPGSKYFKLLQHSNNMAETFHAIAERIKLSKNVTYNLIYPQNIDNHFYLLRGGVDGISDMTLINFIYKVDGHYKINILTYDDVNEIDNLLKNKDEHYIVIDHEYRLKFLQPANI